MLSFFSTEFIISLALNIIMISNVMLNNFLYFCFRNIFICFILFFPTTEYLICSVQSTSGSDFVIQTN